jgi:CubicO group peptidase (beta-lactamase class C family)
MRWTHVLDEYFRHRAAQDLFSGAVLITQGATQLYARAYGYASRAWLVPNTLDTRFDTASVTKFFTAIATLQLIDGGSWTSTRPWWSAWAFKARTSRRKSTSCIS